MCSSLIYCLICVCQQEALYGGLVGHWELAEEPPIPKCLGTDHGGEDWVLTDGQSVYGKLLVL